MNLLITTHARLPQSTICLGLYFYLLLKTFVMNDEMDKTKKLILYTYGKDSPFTKPGKALMAVAIFFYVCGRLVFKILRRVL